MSTMITMKVHSYNCCLSGQYLLICWLLSWCFTPSQPVRSELVWQHIIISWSVIWTVGLQSSRSQGSYNQNMICVKLLNFFAVFTVKVIVKVQILIECMDNIFWTEWLFVAKLSMVIHHHEYCKVCFVTIKVKVTVRTHILKIWPFLL